MNNKKYLNILFMLVLNVSLCKYGCLHYCKTFLAYLVFSGLVYTIEI